VPELPEVETIRRQLEPWVTGRTVKRARVFDPLTVAPLSPAGFVRRMAGRRIKTLTRRGKYLFFELSGGGALMVHLRMTGRLTRFDAGEAHPGKGTRHLRLILELDDGSAVTLHDQRRFGKALILSRDECETLSRRIGPEPLEREFNARSLAEILRNRKRAVKSVLLDQQLIAGIGNIYADEALFRAGIHPERPAGEISLEETERLVRAIKQTLRDAIRLEGSSIDTYRTAGGRRGRFQETFRVHRRAGEPCPACGGTVVKIRVGGRGTYFCPACQK
jgi:formamidopyrimidine-DNA glycosylase